MLHTDLIRPLQEALVAHARERGSAVAFRDDERARTWAELDSRTAFLAGHLAERVERGDTVAICMGNRVEAIESYLAVTRAAAVGAFLSPRASDLELAYMLDDCGAAVLITDTSHLERTWRLAEQAPVLREVIVVDQPHDHDDVVSFERLVGVDPGRSPRDDLGLDEPAWMLYTSGTTGRPKGVLLTQRQNLYVVAACWAPVLGLVAGEVFLSPLPLYHSCALNIAVVAIVATGASERLLGRFSADQVIELLRSEAITLFAGVPTMFRYLLDHLDRQPLAAKALKACASAGAIMPAELVTAFEGAAGVPLLDGYGITETATMVTMNWPTGGRPAGSCGLPLPGSAVRLVDPGTGEDVEFGQEGEVIIRGPHVMIGYHNRPEETARVLRGGWYHSGDLARSDPHGYLTITGRIKELIIRGGENIYPAEVEQAIAEHPDVLDAAVIGRAHETLGEVVVAFVATRDGSEPDVEALRAFLQERIATFKIPAEWRRIDQIPRTGSGKIMRHRLVAQLDEGSAPDLTGQEAGGHHVGEEG
jgi:acyl-CoA synthetase (AMP-forming)/AMP-acid ligase II